jgi:tetratricopeptide (TPR) repeat protein
MRGQPTAIGSVEVLARALREEFPELDPERVKAAVERAVAKAAAAALDTEGYKVVDLHLQRVEATEEASERASILRELSETLEQRGDADRGLVTRLAAFAEAPAASDVLPLLRLARITERFPELPLDKMAALIDINDEAAVARLSAMAEAWQKVGRAYYAADCLERVLLIEPANQHANETLEVFYRSSGEWPVLIDLMSRRAVHVVSDKERAELYREIGVIYERELNDESGALDAFRESDRLRPDNPDVLEAMARLSTRLSLPEEEAFAVLERVANLEREPKARAKMLARAAEVGKLHDWDKSQKLYERALADDPDLIVAIDGLVLLLRDRGELPAAINLLVESAKRPALASERSRWLADAADYRVGLGEFDAAKQLYRAARSADPQNHRAGQALVELCWDTGSLVELAPILEELCNTTDDPERLRSYLMLRSKVAMELGESSAARITLARAVDLDPGDSTSRRELADLLFDNQEWSRARPLIESVLDEEEEQLPLEVAVELNYRIARCAHQLGDAAAATKHTGIALALMPEHRPSLLLRAELDAADPEALLADQLALANTAPADERAPRFAALGDRYSERGDRATAREMYREALRYKPSDHLLLTKSLTLVADEGDWSYSLDLLTRLIETENDPKVRARYRHTSAMIARDELEDPERAISLLEPALEDDPFNFTVADDLEALNAALPERDALARFYYRRLDHVRNAEGRAGERLRLWDKLGDLLLQLARTEDALVAFEVALKLDPDNLDRRIKLADLFVTADPKHAMSAIVQHQTILRSDRRRAASYQALRTLYIRTSQPEKARACDEALTVLGEHVLDEKIDALFRDDVYLPGVHTSKRESQPKVAEEPRARTLANEDWTALARLDVDLRLSALFALVAPPFAAERARVRPPPTLPDHEHPLPPLAARVLAQVLQAFGIQRPPVYLDRDQLAPCKVSMRVRSGVLVPALTIGRPTLEGGIDEPELAFVMARQLADLRNERIARLLCPRAGELAQIIELAITPSGTATHSGRWLSTSLHPMELDQVLAVGGRLRDKQVHPMSAALAWLAATERAADRIGFVVVGKLAPCVRVLEREPQTSSNDLSRVLELVWASVTEEVLAVRGRVEGWSSAKPRQTASMASVS